MKTSIRSKRPVAHDEQTAKVSISITINQNRRRILAAGVLAVLAGPVLASTKPLVEVWKEPACGCCVDWVKHLEANGFRVKTFDEGNSDARAKLGMPIGYGSCHSARVGGYAIEGHVPTADIRRLLRDRPVAVGLAVPAMPLGAPGMDGPEYGGQRDAYDVLLVQRDGSSRIYRSYR